MSDDRSNIPDNPDAPRARRGGRRARAAMRAEAVPAKAVRAGLDGGRYRPLSEADVASVHGAVLDILGRIGLSDAPEPIVTRVVGAGGAIDADGRLTFPQSLVEDAIAGLGRPFTLHGQRPGNELELAGAKVHMGSGGAAPSIVDLETGAYRPATLRDLYDAARLVDALEHVHFFSRSMVATDMSDGRSLDINTAYACLKGTAKHVAIAAYDAAHVAEIAAMLDMVAGGAAKRRAEPVASFNINHSTPPLRFSDDSARVMIRAVEHGIPVHCNAIGQSGAASPVTLAGTLAQTVAEALAGMILCWLVDKDAKAIFGAKPMITDLRTGALTGGGGEQAVVMAAAAQMARFYGFPNVSIAGATDAKAADAQSGSEKDLTVSLAAQAGSNLITQACGMQASLLGCALESYVIDNDMLGAIMRSLRGIEIDAETLALDTIARTVAGEGHYLGDPETLARMETEYVYPAIADRRTPKEWEDDGCLDIRMVAKGRAREILSTHFPNHIGAELDAALRRVHDIRLPVTATRRELEAERVAR